jgi:AcrR family transcriptional regulator
MWRVGAWYDDDAGRLGDKMTATNRSTEESQSPRLSTRIRRPLQKRSRQRFEDILDATERLLNTEEPSEIGIYNIASEAGIPPASVYHVFAEIPLVYMALAERYLTQFEQLAKLEVSADMNSWQDVDATLFERARRFHNQSLPVRKVLLGASPWLGSAQRILAFNRAAAAYAIEQLEAAFILPTVPDLIDRLTEVVALNDAMWVLSYQRYGEITDQMAEQARRARVAYARTFLPEYLPRRIVAAGS